VKFVRKIPLLLVLLIGTLLAGCSTVGQNATGIQNFAQVSPDLYRGAQPTAAGIKMLAARHVKTVVNLRGQDEIDPREADQVRQAGMHYIVLNQDAENCTIKDVEDFLHVLLTTPRPIFVHCHAGRDRTGLAVAAYRICMQKWTVAAAKKELYAYGHYWALFPKIGEVVTSLGDATPARLLADATAKAAEKVNAVAQAPAKN
jgi:protein tyrosine/serine phosphatase